VDGMGVEISSGKVGQVRGVALPGTFLRGPYTRCQKFFPSPLTLTLSPRWAWALT
jgi:hypothetical protein